MNFLPSKEHASSAESLALIQLDAINPNQKFKVNVINNYINKIEADLHRETTACRKYKRWLGVFYWLNVASSTMSVVMSSGSLAALTDVITSPIAVPFTCIVAISGMTTLVTNLIGHKIQHKLKKHREFVHLMETYQFQLQEEIANALTDDIISNEELKAINRIIIAYEKEKTNLRSKWRWKINNSGATPPSGTP
jgi:hypothetical protein